MDIVLLAGKIKLPLKILIIVKITLKIIFLREY